MCRCTGSRTASRTLPSRSRYSYSLPSFDRSPEAKPGRSAFEANYRARSSSPSSNQRSSNVPISIKPPAAAQSRDASQSSQSAQGRDQSLYCIPRSRHNPKILWVDDAEIVGDRITKVRPIPRNLFTQKTERRIEELGASCVGVTFLCMRPHNRSIGFKCGQYVGMKCSLMPDSPSLLTTRLPE